MITPDKKFWDVFRNTDGALSCAEALAIINLTSQLPPNSICLELGTYKGKSAMSAIFGFSTNSSFTLVDPEFSDESFWAETISNISKVLDKSNFLVIVKNSGYSTDVIPNFDKINYVMVDSGSHQDGLPMQEVKLLEDKVVRGGIVAFHDWNSQFHEVKLASDYLVSTGKYEYININWDEIVAYCESENLEDGTNKSWHHNELKHPQFLGALIRK